jgi:hypothetical protein
MRAELRAIPTRRGRLAWSGGAAVALVRLALPEIGAACLLVCLLAAAWTGSELVHPVAREGDLVWLPFVALNAVVGGIGVWAALTRRPLPALVFLAAVAAIFALAVTQAPPIGPFFDAHAAAVPDPRWAHHSWELRVRTGAFAILAAAAYAWAVGRRGHGAHES